MSLPDRPVVAITGASSGIGMAIALTLAPRGAHLILLGRDAARLSAAEAASTGMGASRVDLLAADLGKDADLDRVCQTLGDLPRLDALIHSAGVAAIGPLAHSGVAPLDWQYRINLRAPVAVTQGALSALQRARGQVVFINSGAGLNARKNWGLYAATKHGLRAIADSLREEVAADGVRVLSIYPGRTATPMQARIRKAEGGVFKPRDYIQSRDVAVTILGALELPRTAHMVDVNIRRGAG